MDSRKDFKTNAHVAANVIPVKHNLTVDSTRTERKRKREVNVKELKWNTNIIDLESSNDEDVFDLAKTFSDLKIDEDYTNDNANFELTGSMSVECVKEKRRNQVKLLKRARVYSLVDEIDEVKGVT